MAGINSLVTNGIGPGSSVLFVLTGGLGVGEALPEVVEIPHAQGGGFWPTRESPKKRRPREPERDPLREQIIAAMRGEAEPEEEPEEFRPEPATREQPRRQFLLESVSTLAVDFTPARAALEAVERRAADRMRQDEEEAIMLLIALAA